MHQVRVVVLLAHPSHGPFDSPCHPPWRVALFALGAGGLTLLVFGLAPAASHGRCACPCSPAGITERRWQTNDETQPDRPETWWRRW